LFDTFVDAKVNHFFEAAIFFIIKLGAKLRPNVGNRVKKICGNHDNLRHLRAFIQ
jgi:hypothetical protein